MNAEPIRDAEPGDLEGLLRLEQQCFESDRISRRSFRRWLRQRDSIFLVSHAGDQLTGYVLVITRRGTRLARLYSLAVDPGARGLGLAARLAERAEREARSRGFLYLRLEVATDNAAAIALYRKCGYERFGLYRDYYDDHGDALRMEKCIHQFEPAGGSRVIPWIPQGTAFTCGPASLMMAMASLGQGYEPDPLDEIQIWREATTIFMTSGHGGCHPIGLALSAVRRGFDAEVYLNQREPLFLDSVRDPNKKRVMALAHEGFLRDAAQLGVAIHYEDVDQQQLIDRFSAGDSILVLISTYRLDRKKAPHWVVLSGYDDRCLFVHDPDFARHRGEGDEDDTRVAMDCQHLPTARDTFASMSRFGGSRLRTAVILRAPEHRADR
jgi:ribosomal protein S18 acetylase RimI-like enzyme